MLSSGLPGGFSNVKSLLSLVVALVALLGAGHSLDAHHSFAAEYDGTKPVKVTGTVKRVEWANPHIWFYVEGKDEVTGRTAVWGFSAAPPGMLARRGITKDVLKIGDTIQVEGFLAKDGSPNASGGRVTFADGRQCSPPLEDSVPKYWRQRFSSGNASSPFSPRGGLHRRCAVWSRACTDASCSRCPVLPTANRTSPACGPGPACARRRTRRHTPSQRGVRRTFSSQARRNSGSSENLRAIQGFDPTAYCVPNDLASNSLAICAAWIRRRGTWWSVRYALLPGDPCRRAEPAARQSIADMDGRLDRLVGGRHARYRYGRPQGGCSTPRSISAAAQDGTAMPSTSPNACVSPIRRRCRTPSRSMIQRSSLRPGIRNSA